MNNKKGFTLIELLAVIVILGLLMAIAIPSVTKYISQSRKKTIISTIGNYIGALVNDVNDLTYTFTGSNTVYAVPIECIALERGGTNPFGHWLHANDSYWAYVLVQYDDVNSSYTYGYTFKDSAGYGLYPTSQDKLNEQGKQIQTGLSLSRPQTGKVITITAVSNWSGFKVNDSTDLVVLKAASEGEVGDGVTTCTLQQKGDNYVSVEQGNNNLNETTESLLYFGEKYNTLSTNEEGEWFFTSLIFYQDGSVAFYENDIFIEKTAANFVEYNENIIYLDGEEFIKILSNKKELVLTSNNEILRLEENGIDPVYFGRPYSSVVDGEKYTVVFYEDGSAIEWLNGKEINRIAPGSIIYTNVGLTNDLQKVAVRISSDRKTLTPIANGEKLVLED